MQTHQSRLRVAAWEPSSVVNGPGERFVLWLQGCPILCPGCVNAAYLPASGGTWLDVQWLLDRILATAGLEGVTFSGGEPTVQAESLAQLAEGVQGAGLSVFCYSGYYLSDLRARGDAAIERLLATVDVLVDGPYIAAQRATLPWRGSANQNVHFLSQRYVHLRETALEHTSRAEFIVGRDGYSLTGVWPAEIQQRLSARLRG